MQQKALKKRTKTPEQALASLMRLCARAEKSESDARRLMYGWEIAPAEASKILARLVNDRFIDDNRYAEAFVREKLRLSGWGALKIRAALQRKGIAREIIDHALSQADTRTMSERLTVQLTRKAAALGKCTPYEKKTKLIRYGLSLGFEYETVLERVSALLGMVDVDN